MWSYFCQKNTSHIYSYLYNNVLGNKEINKICSIVESIKWIPKELNDFVKKISGQGVENVICFLLIAYNIWKEKATLKEGI